MSLIDHCRACSSPDLRLVFDFGEMPDAGDFQRHPFSGQKHPLALMQCKECSLFQIKNTLDRDSIYINYKYSSGFSRTLANHFDDVFDFINSLSGITSVLEIGSNDGTLLDKLSQKYVCTGVDPSDIARKAAVGKDWTLINDFFSSDTINGLSLDPPDLIVSCNSFAHNDQIADIASTASQILKDNGYLLIEVQDAELTFSQNQFDTIYREHVCYFTESSLANFLNKYGFSIEHIEKIPIHNGSIRLLGKKIRQNSANTIASSRMGGMKNIVVTPDFRQAIDSISNTIHSLKSFGHSIAGYGASGRATMITNSCHFSSAELGCFFDSNPVKHGLFLPCTDIPIAAKTIDSVNDYEFLLLGAWNFHAELIEEARNIYQFNGKFIIPLPEVTIL